MAFLTDQFATALSNIEPSNDDTTNAIAAHTAVREALEADETLKEYGIDTVLIGSYKRHVSIRPTKDVDVLSKLPALPDEVEPRVILDILSRVLAASFSDERVSLQDRSIKVEFPDYDLHVDAVPARAHGKHWEIPESKDTDEWQETNPEKLTTLTTAMNKKHDGLYVPTVKLLRQTRRAHLGKQPGGLYFEILTYHAFASGNVKGPTQAEYYCSAVSEVVAQIDIALADGLADPTLPDQLISTKATSGELTGARAVFASLSDRLASALEEEDRCRAARVYRDALGKTVEGDWIFPMPEDCNDDGSKKAHAVIIPGAASVPAGDRRFA